MNSDLEIDEGKPHCHPAHFAPVRRHNEPVILQVTVCVSGRRPILPSEAVHKALLAVWQDDRYWRVGEYVVMPDHVHLFCGPRTFEGYPVRRWVGYWKRMLGKIDPALKHVFQEDCWDTQMRDRSHYDEKLSYVRQNPVRRGLVAKSEDWPYQGGIHDLPWT